ncbi:MAG: phosphoserine phosphatase RsbU/P [Bryobacterales bacterium]|nr:phosphoserine phosphatase RsbU/P [Bryobacterales bacterium]
MKIPGLNKRAPLYIAVALVVLDVLLILTGKASVLAILLSLGLIGYGLVRLLKMALRRSHLIWRLRNRLMVTYVFIGAVPIVLVLALSFFGAWIVVGQVATYLVRSELDRRTTALEEPARVLSRARTQERVAMLHQMAPLFRDRAPGAEILVTSDDGEPPLRYPSDSRLEPLPHDWKDYKGLVFKDGHYYAISVAHHAGTQALICVPLRAKVLESLVPGIGSLALTSLKLNRAPRGKTVKISPDEDIDFSSGLAGTVPPAYTWLDTEFPRANFLEVYLWDEPGKAEQSLLNINTRTSAVLSVVFANQGDMSQNSASQLSLIGFMTIAILLAIVELISAAIGVSMTGTITGAVHNLYEGTLKIGRGDFSHRIPVKGSDQLADLGHSFNQMTEQLENLVIVAKEKERLQSELAIASEVQKQLFPRSAPTCHTIELIGACEPARSASGDYYDYLLLPNGNLAVAIGDVAGKGISAALLMASIQSIMRTQLLAGQAGRLSTASIVAQLNRQLYANTSPEKYATFFFGVYEEATRELIYTNAGHLSPLILRDGRSTELEVTGTVVGLFPASQYEEQRVTLASGDLLVAFTDGITEPENAYGEEFGSGRLSDTVLRHQKCETVEIVAKVMEAVKHWSNAPELPDDMTVLIARGLYC